MALYRTSTASRVSGHPTQRMVCASHTRCPIPNDTIQCPNKVSEHSIDMVESNEDGYDVGARVGVSFREDAGEEDAQCLPKSAFIFLEASDPATYLERVCLRGTGAFLQRDNRPGKQLPRLVLPRKHICRPDVLQHLLQPRPIRPEQEELAPEALCLFGILIVL